MVLQSMVLQSMMEDEMTLPLQILIGKEKWRRKVLLIVPNKWEENQTGKNNFCRIHQEDLADGIVKKT